MNIKCSDLLLLVEYIKKEKAEFVDLFIENFKVTFSFRDLESRSCTITLFESSTKTTPDLTKQMKLYTRTKEGKKDE